MKISMTAVVVRYSELMDLMLRLGRERRMPAATARRIAETLAASHAPTAARARVS